MSNNTCPNCGRNLGTYYGTIEVTNECFYCKFEEKNQNIFKKWWKQLKAFVYNKWQKNLAKQSSKYND